MAAKGSRLSRMLDFFKAGDIEEARYIAGRALEIVKERVKPKDGEAPAPRRKRRTKAQIAAAQGKDAHTAMAANA